MRKGKEGGNKEKDSVGNEGEKEKRMKINIRKGKEG